MRGAGSSGRRRTVLVAVVLLVAAPALAWAGLRNGWLRPAEHERLTSQSLAAQNDVSAVQTILARMRGTNAFACELALVNIDHRNWFGGLSNQISDSPLADDSTSLHLPGELDAPGVVDPLMTALRDPDACVRRTAASLLGRTKAPAAAERLRSALDDSDAQMRALAAFSLGLIEDQRSGDHLLRLLRDASPVVRAAAAWALGELEYKPAIARLAELLASDTSPRVRRAAARALGDIAG